MIEVNFKGTGDVNRLRAALAKLALRIPAANPGPAQQGDPEAVTDQLIQALIAVVNRIDMPSEVKFVLSAVPSVAALSSTVKSALRVTVSKFAGPMATAINVYEAKLALMPGGVPPRFPAGSIATQTGSQWAVAVPGSGSAMKGALGCGGVPCGEVKTLRGATLRDSVITLEGSRGLGFMFTHYGMYPDPGNAKVVSSDAYATSTGWKPWYKRWYSIVGMAVGGAGVVGGLGWLIFSKRRKS